MQRRGRYHVLTKERTMLLRCGISIRLTSAQGQPRRSPFSALCQLPPAVDITPQMLTPCLLGAHIRWRRRKSLNALLRCKDLHAFSFRFRSEFAGHDGVRATPWLPKMEGRHLGPHAQPGRRLPSMIDQPPPPEPHRATFWVIIAGLVLVMLLTALSAVIPKLTVIALSE